MSMLEISGVAAAAHGGAGDHQGQDCSAAPPTKWRATTLGKLLRPRREKRLPSDLPDSPYIGMEHVEPHSMRLLNTVPARTMRSSANRFYAGDVLYGRLRPYLNKIYKSDFEGLCSAEFIVLPKTAYIDADFLKYRLNAADFVHFASHLNAGDRPRVDFDQISSFEVSLPPLDEQHRIVAEIEKQFTRLDAGVASLKRVQVALKRYRASVLKAACEGRAYEPASELLARILQERRAQWESVQLAKFEAASRAPKHPGWKNKYEGPQPLDEASMPKLPAGWVWTNLDTVIVDGPQNGLYLPKTRYGRGHPILRIDDFQNGWVRTAAELNTVEADPETILTYRLELMDLVINRVNSLTHLGKCLVVRENVIPCLFESNMMRAKLACAMTPRYVELYLHSAHGRIRLTKRAKWAVNQASINQQDVRQTLLPLPPVAEQERIVAEVEQRFSVIDELETVVMANIKRTERLRQSILQHAFGGRL